MISNFIRNGSSTDKLPVVIENASGVGITGLTSASSGLTAYLSKGGNWAAFSLTGVFSEPALTSGAPANTGLYYVSLSATDTNTNGVNVLCIVYQGVNYLVEFLVWSDFQADITAIKAKTDNLPATPANEATSTAIKAKTDLIPASPASETTLAAVKAKTDNLPAAPAATGDVTAAQTAILAAVSGITSPDAATIADAVWDEPRAGHVTAGTFGPYIDAAISSRKADFVYTAPDNTSITAIKARTDNLPATPANEATSTAIKAKTDNLPAAPAATGDVTAAQTAIIDAVNNLDVTVDLSAVALESSVQAVKAKTDLIPASPATAAGVAAVQTNLHGDIVASTSTILNAISGISVSVDLSDVALEASVQTLITQLGALSDTVDGINLSIDTSTLAQQSTLLEIQNTITDHGDRLLRILALLYHNAVMDEHDYDGDGNLTYARIRAYDTAANAAAATNTGLLFTLRIDSVFVDGVNRRYSIRSVP